MEYATLNRPPGIAVERGQARMKIIALASGAKNRAYCSATWPQRRRLCLEQLEDRPMSVVAEALELLRKYG